MNKDIEKLAEEILKKHYSEIEDYGMLYMSWDGLKEHHAPLINAFTQAMCEMYNKALQSSSLRPEVICYCGSIRVAIDAFKKVEYDSVMNGTIALLPCCMFVDIEREYGAKSDYKIKADAIHKRKIDICDKIVVLNVGGYIGESTRSEIEYATKIGKPIEYLESIPVRDIVKEGDDLEVGVRQDGIVPCDAPVDSSNTDEQ